MVSPQGFLHVGWILGIVTKCLQGSITETEMDHQGPSGLADCDLCDLLGSGTASLGGFIWFQSVHMHSSPTKGSLSSFR